MPTGATGINRRDALVGLGLVAAVASTSGMAAPQDVEIGETTLLNQFVPIDPKQVLKVRHVVNNQEKDDYYASLKEEDIREILSLQKAFVSIEQRSVGGGLKHLLGSITAEKGEYVVTVDYARYKDEDVTTGGKTIGRGRVGVGLRLVATLATQKANLDVSSPLAISANVSAGKMAGRIESTVIGIVSPRVSDLIQLPTEITQQSITKAIESMGAMKVLVDAPDTKTVPYLLAVSLIANNLTPADVAKPLTSS